jgi:peroxiredoxin
VPVADPKDLAALRLAYIRLAHPDLLATPEATVAKDEAWDRGEASAELFRRYGRNPPLGATAAEIRAQIAKLDDEAKQAQARDQAAAAGSVSRAPPRRAPSPEAAATPPAKSVLLIAPPMLPGADGINAQRDAERAMVGVAVGKPFPALAGRAVDGADFALHDWKGKVVLVDYWATWCGPCMHELPNVQAIYKDYHARGFEIVGVSLDENAQVLKRTLAEQGIPWPQLCDGGGWEGALAKRCAVRAIPAAFLIGADGVLIATDLRGGELGAAVAKALGERP